MKSYKCIKSGVLGFPGEDMLLKKGENVDEILTLLVEFVGEKQAQRIIDGMVKDRRLQDNSAKKERDEELLKKQNEQIERVKRATAVAKLQKELVQANKMMEKSRDDKEKKKIQEAINKITYEIEKRKSEAGKK